MISKVITFFSFVLLVTGCYTIMKHPAIEVDYHSSNIDDIYLSDECVSCHSMNQLELITANPEYRNNLNYIYRSSRWTYYYEHPWWHRDRFVKNFSPELGPAEDPALPTTSSRPRFPGSNSGQEGSASPTSIGGGNTPSAASTTRISSGGQTTSGGDSSNSANTNIRQNSSIDNSRTAGNRESGENPGPQQKTKPTKRSQK